MTMTRRFLGPILSSARERPPRLGGPWLVATGVFCVALVAVSVSETSVVDQVPLAVAFVIGFLQAGSVALAIVSPRTAIAVHIVAIVVNAMSIAGSDASPWPISVIGLVATCGLLVVLGLRESWGVAASAWLAFLVLTIAVVAFGADRFDRTSESGNNILTSVNSTIVMTGAAIAVGQRRRIRAELAAVRRDVALEQERREQVEDRQRIARELHDVVAHSMSIVHMQATSAPYRIADLGPEARREFIGIAESARSALREMRQLLGVLREDDAAALLAPQPGMSDIAALVESIGRAGVTATLTVDDSGATIDPVVQLTAFRLTQEALSNVARHAPGSSAAIRIETDESAMTVTVVNGPPAEHGVDRTPDANGGGQGLVGMRERVALLGGSFANRATDDGGYSVTARLPLTGSVQGAPVAAEGSDASGRSDLSSAGADR